jgi:hypothetical protein
VKYVIQDSAFDSQSENNGSSISTHVMLLND